MKGTWLHLSVHWQQGKYQSWANCFMGWMLVASWDPRILETPLTTHCCSVLTPRPWPIRQKRISTSWAVSHIGYNIQSIPGRNDSPLSCFESCTFSKSDHFLSILIKLLLRWNCGHDIRLILMWFQTETLTKKNNFTLWGSYMPNSLTWG